MDGRDNWKFPFGTQSLFVRYRWNSHIRKSNETRIPYEQSTVHSLSIICIIASVVSAEECGNVLQSRIFCIVQYNVACY